MNTVASIGRRAGRTLHASARGFHRLLPLPDLLPATIAALLLAGCASLAPDYRTPAVELPPDTAIAETRAPWWLQGADPALSALIDEALAHNADLAIAATRIERARAALGVARASQLPDAGAQLGASRERDESLRPGIHERYNAQLLASWELDLWGKYRDGSDAARERLLAAAANREALRLSLASSVAQTWYAWTADALRLTLAERTLAAQNAELALLRRRVEGGIAGEFELRQQEAEVAATTVLVQQLLGARQRSRNALGILLGRSPKALVEGTLPAASRIAALPVGEAIVALPVPDSLPAGLPSSRLLLRPDVQAAEANLKAANAEIGVARAAWFPALTLTASGGGVSSELSSLFDAGSRAFAVGATLLQPLVFSGRIAAGVGAATAERDAAIAAYRQTVANAFRDLLDALTARQTAQAVAAAEAARVAALAETLRLARRRHDAGLIGLFEVLGSERALLAAQGNLIEARRAEAAAAVQLWTALGG